MNYIVHSNNPQAVLVQATTDKGTKVDAPLPGNVVELLPVDGGKTVTLELHEDNWAGLPPAEMFAIGNEVSIGFTLVKKAEAAPK